MIFMTGGKYIWCDKVVTVVGKDEFQSYEHNRPGKNWELIKDENGLIGWVGNIHLKRARR